MPLPSTIRLALPSDAGAIAAVQQREWGERYGQETRWPADAENLWWQAIARPPLAQFRVLVALTSDKVVGFAAVGPSGDPDTTGEEAEVGEFVAHGDDADRLLHACVDTMAADGFSVARWWVGSTDDPCRNWLEQAGWASDGAHREIGDEESSLTVKMVRLHTSIASHQ